MMTKLKTFIPEFLQGLEGQLQINEPMRKHTSWRTGGVAEYFYTPANRVDLIALLNQLPSDLPVHWIGLGSNLLVRDGGVKGIVIRTSKGLAQIREVSENRLYAESGVSCAKVARIAARKNLLGVEFLAGVPGSFGGALAMNAGAFGGEIWERVEKIECINRQGEITEIKKSEIEIGYRHVGLAKDQWVLGGTLLLEPAPDEYNGKDTIRSLLEQRSDSQPIQSANAGSVFRNPEGDHAARLIDELGLKGYRQGDAEISQVHANFIINRGKATAGDIESLIAQVQQRVRDHSGTTLELEVRIIGEEQ